MISVIQRVSSASVEVKSEPYTTIESGLLILLGVKKGDTVKNAVSLARKTADLRIFPDKDNKMNLSVKDLKGEILVISQFTLCTDNDKSGNRPSFIYAEDPEKANELYEMYIAELRNYYDESKVFTGIFAEEMTVKLVNEGPVTIILEK